MQKIKCQYLCVPVSQKEEALKRERLFVILVFVSTVNIWLTMPLNKVYAGPHEKFTSVVSPTTNQVCNITSYTFTITKVNSGAQTLSQVDIAIPSGYNVISYGTPNVANNGTNGTIFTSATQQETSTRQLHNEGTKGEAILWFNALKARKMYGYQFNRQYLISNYIVDFICRKLNLIIEMDSSSHRWMQEEDRKTQDDLESLGYLVLRFSEAGEEHQIDDVVGETSYAVKSLEKNIKLPPT